MAAVVAGAFPAFAPASAAQLQPPAANPPNDSDFWRLMQLLQMLLQVLDGPSMPAEEPEELFRAITDKYSADGVPSTLTEQERADVRAWIDEINVLLVVLEGSLDPLETAAFRVVLESIYLDVGGQVRWVRQSTEGRAEGAP